MLTLLVFVIILGILIFVHELGHFVVARRNGIKAEEFGFGFPPRIFGFQKIGKKWRFIWGKKDTDREWENKDHSSEGTIFSLNWFPLGGFVKIKGENGEGADEPDSFASKPAWARIKVLAAGVTMNFILAWLVVSLALTIGAPQELDNARGNAKDLKIQISEVKSGSVAENMGFKVGDEVLQCLSPDPACIKKFSAVEEVISFIGANAGKEIVLKVKRGDTILNLKGFPQFDEKAGRGLVGVGLVQTAIVAYPWYQALVEGLIVTWRMIEMVFVTFYTVIGSLFGGEKVSVEVAGPVGIVYFTKQVTELGFVYILQFIAILSVNLGIINILPFPALDGGRILFILIEKVKGSPVSAKVEHTIHTVGFMLLIGLMLFVTMKDIVRFDIWEKLTSLF
jgi:regulator of sigma E protease